VTDRQSGKSTLLGAILRMIPETTGKIVIDSVDASQVDLWTLRRRLITIPQDFVHLPGSMRFNLDPFQQCSDNQIESSLKKVNLWSRFDPRNDLNSEFDSERFSSGEKQLLSLARAILQREAQQTALVLMDEATSSLDDDIEELVHKLLREEFKDCTVISIAHRAASIQRADLVVMMDGGRIVEVAEPKNLKYNVVLG
jgi:ATP-binding cassette subfamily C (CFTR/MRP) protein 1